MHQTGHPEHDFGGPVLKFLISLFDRSKEMLSEKSIRKQNVDRRLAKSFQSKEKWFLVANIARCPGGK